MKGKVEEKVGQVTSNPGLAAEGQAEKLAGKVQKKVGQMRRGWKSRAGRGKMRTLVRELTQMPRETVANIGPAAARGGLPT